MEQDRQERSELHYRLMWVSGGRSVADQLGIHGPRPRQPEGRVSDATTESSDAIFGPAPAVRQRPIFCRPGT